VKEEAMPWLVGYPRDKIPWYPTVDQSKCIGCGVCLNCGRNVFAWQGGKPLVARPYECVIGCTTCANLCPAWAISFPDIESVRAIYKREGIWEKIRQALKQEGRID
jgi:NAD-dependent dihydropyrimidine dehydrogenase PreA subunit